MDRPRPLSAWAPGSVWSIAYGLVLPAPRTFEGRFRTFSAVRFEEMDGVSVAITPADDETSTVWVIWPISSRASTLRRVRASRLRPCAEKVRNPGAVTTTL